MVDRTIDTLYTPSRCRTRDSKPCRPSRRQYMDGGGQDDNVEPGTEHANPTRKRGNAHARAGELCVRWPCRWHARGWIVCHGLPAPLSAWEIDTHDASLAWTPWQPGNLACAPAQTLRGQNLRTEREIAKLANSLAISPLAPQAEQT